MRPWLLALVAAPVAMFVVEIGSYRLAERVAPGAVPASFWDPFGLGVFWATWWTIVFYGRLRAGRRPARALAIALAVGLCAGAAGAVAKYAVHRVRTTHEARPPAR